MSAVARMECSAHRENIATIMRFVDERCACAALDGEDAVAVRLAVEEVCENVVKYAYAGRETGPITLEFASSPWHVSVSIEDHGVAFDPTQLAPADVTSDWKSRKIGGLGWHLVKKLMDDVRHDAISSGGNRVTLTKRRATAL